MMEAIDEDEDVEIEKELEAAAATTTSTATTDKASSPALPDFDPRTAKLYEPQKFAPKDLLALLRNIETDIADCEVDLKDENEKHKKHTVDDCRR